MKDMVINIKYSKVTKNADEIRKWKQLEILEKNQKRFESYSKKNNLIKD
jgi:hypothetical protein